MNQGLNGSNATSSPPPATPSTASRSGPRQHAAAPSPASTAPATVAFSSAPVRRAAMSYLRYSAQQDSFAGSLNREIAAIFSASAMVG